MKAVASMEEFRIPKRPRGFRRWISGWIPYLLAFPVGLGWIMTTPLHGDGTNGDAGGEMNWIVIHRVPAFSPSAPPFMRGGPTFDRLWVLEPEQAQTYGIHNQRSVLPPEHLEGPDAARRYRELHSILRGREPVRVDVSGYARSTGLTVEHVPETVHVLAGSAAGFTTYYSGPSSRLPEDLRMRMDRLEEEFTDGGKADAEKAGHWLRAVPVADGEAGPKSVEAELPEDGELKARILRAVGTPYRLIALERAEEMMEFLNARDMYRAPVRFGGLTVEFRILDVSTIR